MKSGVLFYLMKLLLIIVKMKSQKSDICNVTRALLKSIQCKNIAESQRIDLESKYQKTYRKVLLAPDIRIWVA